MKTLLFLIALLWSLTWAQQAYTGTVRGLVQDVESKAALSDATIEVLQDSSVITGGYTDANGRFEINEVPVGRISIRVSYLGYETALRANLLLITGKDLQLTIEMQESLTRTETVTVKAGADKKDPQNAMTTLSARTMNMEEANRYAGSLGDPGRMASNFAGVASGGDSRNDIVVRGNSPTTLLWRLEGVDIPNPNHFSTQGAGGGPISILNNNLLANSDFMTGAFPAEYSNAIGAAFDLKLRNGNTAKRENMFQIGFNGLELMTEGPIGKGGQNSYLASYRYSTLAAFDAIGITWPGVIGTPEFQDLSFKLNFQKTPIGRISVFGVGGISSIDNLESELDSKEFQDNTQLNLMDVYQRARMGVAGIQNAIFLDEKSYLQTTLAISHTNRSLKLDSVDLEQGAHPDYRENTTENKLMLAMVYNRKINAKHTLRLGFFADHLMADYRDSVRLHTLGRWYLNRDVQESTQLLRPYAQWQWRMSERWTLNTGINMQYLTLNSRTAVEPRAGLKYKTGARSSLSAAYGMHHQVQPWMVYYFQDSLGRRTNEELGYTRSQHYVLGYDWSPLKDFRIKLETYYQAIDKVPVDATSSSFSLLNFGVGFESLPRKAGLINEGSAHNYGIELTAEKFLSKGYYFLFTTSLFNSEYKASNGQTYNTVFNNGYVINGLLGIEKPVGKKKVNSLIADLKITTAGGIRYTPINQEASMAAGTTIRQNDKAFSQQAPAYFRADIKVGFRQNFRKISQEWAVQIQNVTAHENILAMGWDRRTGNTVEYLQLGFFPVVQYKINF